MENILCKSRSDQITLARISVHSVILTKGVACFFKTFLKKIIYNIIYLYFVVIHFICILYFFAIKNM